MLKDYWGNDALDFGNIVDLWNKYPDKVLVTASNKPFGKSYVLFTCDKDEQEKADAFLENYRSQMKKRGIKEFAAGVSLGAKLQGERLSMFMRDIDI